MIQKAYKYRILPTKEQEIMFAKTFGACRWYYNYALSKIKTAYEADKTKIKIGDISSELPILNKAEETKWLSEVSSTALGWSIRNLNTAYQNFFRRVKKGENPGYPKFKSKHNNHQSFQFHQRYSIDFEKGTMNIPKMKGLKVIFHRTFDGVPKTCTISRVPSGKYFISILVETLEEIPTKPEVNSSDSITIHLGVRNFAYLDDGTIIKHPKYFHKSLEKLRFLDRRLAGKKNLNKDKKRPDKNEVVLPNQFVGANIEKARIKRATLHEYITNQRANFLHNLSCDLVKKNKYSTIIIENWQIAEMIKDNFLARYIADSGWRIFWSQVDYKAHWNGKNVLKTESEFPSSKKCSECGNINDDLKLSQIRWTCPVCKTRHNREVNAVKNIAQEVFI